MTQMSLNTDKFSANLKRTQNELKVAKNEILEAGDGIQKFGTNLETLGQKFNAINNAIQKNNDKMKLYKDEIDKINAKTKEQVNGLKTLSDAKDKASKKYDEMVKVYGKESEEAKKAKEEVDKLSKQYKQQEKSIEGNVKKMDEYTVQLSNIKRENSGLETELKKTTDAIEKEADMFLKASDKLETASNKMKNIGDGFSNIGDSILKITTPIIAGGTAIAKFSMDFEDAMAKVSTLSDQSGIPLDTFKEKIIALSNETGKPVNELAESLYEVLSSGVEAGKSVEFLAMANQLSVAGFTDTGKAVDVLTTAINAYGLEVDDAQRISDVLIETQNLGKTTIDQLASSLGKVIPTASANSVSIEQLGASYALMTSNGIATAESTTYLNSMLNELSKTGSDADGALKEMTGKTFKELSEEGKSLSDVLGILSEYAEASGLNLTDMFGSAEAGKAALVLAKDEGQKFNDVLKEMEGALGSTQKGFDKVDDTAGTKLKKSINELKNSFLDMGDNLAPIISRVSDAIKKVADAIGDMDDEQIDNIINWTKMGVEIGVASKLLGGTLTVFGNVTSGLSKLTGFISNVSSASGELGTVATVAGKAVGGTGFAGSLSMLSSVALPLVATIGALGAGFAVVKAGVDVASASAVTAKDEFNLLEIGMSKLMGVQLRSREELEETGLIYKQFSENVSPEFRDAVEGMREDIAEFNLAISETSLDGAFTQEELDSLRTQVQGAVDGAISAINEKQAETNEALSNLFATDGVFSEKETELMNWWSTRGTKEKEEAIRLQTEINEIEDTAFNEGRALTPEEEQAILDRYERIKQIELMAKARNSDELKLAEVDFQNQIVSLDADGASKLIQQKIKQADELLLQKQNEIDLVREQIKSGYDQMSEDEKRHADETLAQLDIAEADYLEQDRIFRENLFKQAFEGNSKLEEEIDRYSGELLTNADKRCKDELELLTTNYANMNKVTESGMYRMLNKVTGSYDDMYIEVDEKTGDIIGAVKTWTDEQGMHTEDVIGYNKKIKGDMQTTADKIVQDYNRMARGTVNSSGEIIGANGEVIGSLKDIKVQADGTRTGIVNLNGQKVRITVDKWGTITDLNEINSSANYASRDRTSRIYFQSYGLDAINYTYRNGVAVPLYATGTPNNPENTTAIINEKGWELVDTKPNVSAFALGSNSVGDLAYIPEGTRIKSNLTSTQEMKAEIKAEVAKYNNNITVDDFKYLIGQVIKAIKENGGADVDISNNFNIQQSIDTEFDENRLANNIDKLLVKDLRKFGKIMPKR